MTFLTFTMLSFKVFWLLISQQQQQRQQDHSGIQWGIHSGIQSSIRSFIHSFIQSLIQCGTLPGCCELLMTFYYRSVESTVSLRICVSVSVCNYLPTVSRYYAINAFYLMSSPAPGSAGIYMALVYRFYLWYRCFNCPSRRNLLLRLPKHGICPN